MKNTILALMLLISLHGFSQTLPYKQWQQSYRPQNPSWISGAYDSKLDNQGNLIVAGKQDSAAATNYSKGSFVTKFKKQGGIEWTALNPGYHSSINSLSLNAVDVDNQNNIYAAGRSDSSSFFGRKATLLKYSSTGTLLWEKHIGVNPYYKSCEFSDVSIDAQGNIVAAGYVITSTGGADTNKLLMVKYNPAGTLLWMQLYLYQKGSGVSSKIAFDNNSNIFVFHQGLTFIDKVVVMMSKFNSSGMSQWTTYYQGTNFGGVDNVYDLKIGPDNNPVYMYVLNNSAPSFSTLCITKLNNADGGPVFNQSYGVGFISADELPGNLLINAANEIFFCYSSQSSTQTGYEGIIYKLNPNGGVVLNLTFNTLPMSPDYIKSIGLDADNNIYALAYSSYLAKGYVIRYGNSGNKIWETNFTPNSFNNSSYAGMHIGVNKEIYLALTTNPVSGYEATAYKFIQVPGQISQPPSRVTAKPIADFQDTYDTLNVSGIPASAVILRMEVKLDSITHTYPHDLTIHLTSPGGYRDSILKEPGQLLPGTGYFRTILSDTASKIIDSASNPFTGYFRPSRSLSSYNYLRANGSWILRIRDNAISDNGTLYKWGLVITYFDSLLAEVKTIALSNIPEGFSLSQNYPNPFNPATKINFNLPAETKVQLDVYDITGRLIQTLLKNENFSEGYHTVQFNGSAFSSGIYFYKITAGEFVQTKKMMLVK